jgi:hypothetical protein
MLQAHFADAAKSDYWQHSDVPDVKEIEMPTPSIIEFPKRDRRGGSYIVIIPDEVDPDQTEIKIVPVPPIRPVMY